MLNTSGVNSLITRGSFFVVDCGDAGSRLIDCYRLQVLFIGLVLLLDLTWSKIAPGVEGYWARKRRVLFLSIHPLRLVNVNLAPLSFSLCRPSSILVTSSLLITLSPVLHICCQGHGVWIVINCVDHDRSGCLPSTALPLASTNAARHVKK